MSYASPTLRGIAQRLVAYEAKGNNRSRTIAPVVFGGAMQKLHRPLVALTGSGGFRSLLSRALALVNDEVLWLRAVHVKSDGALELPDLTKLDKKEVAEGEVALLAQLLTLLVTFIGGPLTLRLVQDAWPKAPIDHLDFGKEEK